MRSNEDLSALHHHFLLLGRRVCLACLGHSPLRPNERFAWAKTGGQTRKWAGSGPIREVQARGSKLQLQNPLIRQVWQSHGLRIRWQNQKIPDTDHKSLQRFHLSESCNRVEHPVFPSVHLPSSCHDGFQREEIMQRTSSLPPFEIHGVLLSNPQRLCDKGPNDPRRPNFGRAKVHRTGQKANTSLFVSVAAPVTPPSDALNNRRLVVFFH